MLLNGSQSITLKEPLSQQKTGIVLEWSKYESPNAVDYDFNYIFIPKETPTGKRISFILSGYDTHIGKKTIWISDTGVITGIDSNGTTQSEDYITYYNHNYAIRRVLGV